MVPVVDDLSAGELRQLRRDFCSSGGTSAGP